MDLTYRVVRRALLGAVARGLLLSLGALGVGACVSACAQDNAAKFSEPPAETYTASTVQLTIDGKPQAVNAGQVTDTFFAAAHVRPHLGRTFIQGDFLAAPTPVVVISFSLWQRLGASPEIIGSQLPIDGRSLTVVGVAEREFNFPKDAELWTPKARER